MNDIKITIASLKSVLLDTNANLQQVKEACEIASNDKARMLFLPELMLTGHGAHYLMSKNAEPVPEGPLSRAVLNLSKEYDMCISVGIAESDNNVTYNSQMVVDKGKYLGLQRKINLSGDEYCYFRAGTEMNVFDIGDIRFGIVICYDNHFPELGLALSLQNVDLILSPHAARNGQWPKNMTEEFTENRINILQQQWETTHRARACDYNAFVLVNNAVGSSMEGIEQETHKDQSGQVLPPVPLACANHLGTVMAIEPEGNVLLRTSKKNISNEIVTVNLEAKKRVFNHGPARNRNIEAVIKILDQNSRKNKSEQKRSL